MSKTNDKLQPLAYKLADYAAQAGEPGVADVVTGLKKVLEPLPLAQRKAFMRSFRNRLRLELKRRELTIEYAGTLSQADIENLTAHYSKLLGHELRPVVQENPALISGLRLQVGDNVYENSVADRLKRLADHI